MTTEPRLGPRFGPEAGLILGAAAFAALLELSWLGVIAVVLCAWLAVAIFEIVRARTRPEPFAAPPSGYGEPPAEPEPAREPEPEPEPSRAAEPTESADAQAASLVAAPEQVEAAPSPDQERRS